MNVNRIAKRIAADVQGHSIDINCFYDIFESESLFNENFKVIGRDRRGDAYVLLYTDHEIYPDEILEVVDYEKYGEEYDDEYETDYNYIVNNWWPKTLIPIIASVCSLEEVSKSCGDTFASWDDFEKWMKDNENYGNPDYDWLFEILPPKAIEAAYAEAKKDVKIVDFETIFRDVNFWRGEDFSDIGLALKPGYQWYISRGYSQGDAVIVICDASDSHAGIDHLIWDARVSCTVEIDGIDYFVSGEMKDQYYYDKDEAIEIVRQMMGDQYDDEIDAYLKENMPDEPKWP